VIFISYRREDTIGNAGRLFDRLVERFGREAVCRDIDSLPAGEDFVVGIKQKIEHSDVLLALIGPRWLTAADDEGHWRLADENDLVRLEIVTALERNIRVIPVLLHGARMPKAKDLPGDLAPLARKNAVEIRDTSFDRDVDQLVNVLAPAWHHKLIRILKRRPVYVPATVLVAVLLGIWAYPYVVLTPEKVRIQIVQMGLAYDADTFVQRAAQNDERAVDLFLRAGMPPDAPNRGDNTALMLAAGNGHLALVKRLVDKGADVNRALPWASDDREVVTFLLTRKPTRDAVNLSLRNAAGNKDAEVMNVLLDAGADVNFQKDDSTPLSEAARRLNLAGVQLLLTKGAKVNPEFREGWLPLHHAIGSRSSPSEADERIELEVVEALLDRGANMETRATSMAKWQPTPLLLAIDGLRSRIALLLIERGADVNTKTFDPGGKERTALMWASEKGLDDVVRALLAKGAPVNARNDVGETALLVGAQSFQSFGKNQAAVVKTLLEAGADIEARSSKGGTALMRAAPENNGVLPVLLDRGANVNAATNAGFTALMIAADAGQVENINFLLSKGADPRLKNKEGQDAIAIAMKADQEKAVEALKLANSVATARH